KYTVDRNHLVPSRTNYRISREDFRKTFELGTLPGPGIINHLVRGPSYVWAVLHDTGVARG
ncbi:MAG TPA: hypothetical protein VN317_01820, partial [Candidatus Methanoperedens sp.]|nr:hypothetical protein [Candidatus Methanoperedens sp.]